LTPATTEEETTTVT